MSAIDFTARALAVAAASDQPLLFVEWASRSVTDTVDRVETSGYAQPGQGAGTYVSDALCDNALFAAHPRFVFRTANLRVFRLVAENGAIGVEQGGAVGVPGTNDQPAIQAAIDYAQAVGIGEVAFSKPLYELWCPPRTHAADGKFQIDGHPLVVQRSLRLIGAGPSRTVLDFKGLNGANPETSWQVVATSSSDSSNAVWRGGGLLVLGDQSDPGGNFAIGRLELSRLIFSGNRLRTGNHAFPASTTTGDGWDLTDKGLWMQDTRVGDLTLIDTDFIGWKGEIVYLAGYEPRSFTAIRCRFLTSNGNALNLLGNRRVVDCEMGDAYQAEESVAAYDAVYTNCLWRDANFAGLGGGNLASLSGYPYSFPSRNTGVAPPRMLIEGGEFRACAQVQFGSWVHARARFVDSYLWLDTASTYGLEDLYCEIDAWMDQTGSLRPLTLAGPPTLTTAVPGAPGGTYVAPPSNVHVKMSCRRTELAKTSSRHWLAPYWTGYLDKSCRIEMDVAELQGDNGPACFDTPPKSFPFVWIDQPINTHSGLAYPVQYRPAANISASGELALQAPVIGVSAASAATFDLTLPTAPSGGSTYGYAEGQRFKLVKRNGTGTLRFVMGASGTFKVPADRSLTNNLDWIEFTWNPWATRWEEAGFFTSV